jgi:hypothetical protein
MGTWALLSSSEGDPRLAVWLRRHLAQATRSARSPTARAVGALLLSALIASSSPVSASASPLCLARVTSEEEGPDIAWAAALPNLGKWMLDHSGSPAHWLGEIYEGKALREPINVVIVDAVATDHEVAKHRVVEASASAGYGIRMGHSSGYRAMIGGELKAQLPAGWDDAFSNRLFAETNNHGRLFGPYQQGSAYVFVGAFSREQVSLLHWPEHRYASFNKARDEFAASLDLRTEFKFTGAVTMHNAITADANVTTGDHDGKAVVLCARAPAAP